MRRKRKSSVSRIKRSLRAQEPNLELEPGHHSFESLKSKKVDRPTSLPLPTGSIDNIMSKKIQTTLNLHQIEVVEIGLPSGLIF